MPREKHEKTEVQVDVEGRTMKLSNLEKVLYPRTGTTKGEVLNYYARIAPVMLPHLADRAVTRIRWPHGTEDMSFFEKNIPNGTPSWVHTVKVPTTGSRTASKQDGMLVFPIVDDLATLDLAGQPRGARAARPPVDGRPQRPAAQRRPAGHRPRPGRAGRAARVLPGGTAGAGRARRQGPGRQAGDQRQQGPAPVRRPAASAAVRTSPRRWPRTSPRRCRRSTPPWSPPR